jgi:acyl-CoA thioesterase-1
MKEQRILRAMMKRDTLRFCLLCCLLVLFMVACGGVNTTTTLSQHAPLPAQGSSAQIMHSQITYVALGASDAVGVGSNRPGSQGYVPLIAARLQKGSHMIDLGISGIQLHAALNQELPLALGTNPNLITIWLVTNDFVADVPYDQYMHDLNSFLQQLRAGTKALIVIANLPDLTRLPLFKRQSEAAREKMITKIELWNAMLARIAARYQVKLVDLFSHQSQLTNHPDYISSDGFHPSPVGYVQLANFFWDALQGK